VADFFQKLFGTKTKTKIKDQPVQQKPVDLAVTAPLSDQQINSILSNQSLKYEMKQLVAGVGQSVGKQREHNEDSLLALTSTISGGADSIPFGLYIVADGMGGHQFGEVASNAAVRIMAGNITKKFHSYLYNLPTQILQESLQEVMETSIMEAHQYVQREAPGSGTTVTAALVLGQQMTVKRLEELGHLSKDEAANFPHRNVLIRALGQGEALEADIFTVPFPQTGYLMICSDGLWGVISDKDISRFIVEAPNLHRACQSMVEAANAAGGPDNITVVLAQMIG
jgi:serine/threonine protein phosphatase PrpC